MQIIDTLQIPTTDYSGFVCTGLLSPTFIDMLWLTVTLRLMSPILSISTLCYQNISVFSSWRQW